MRVLSEAWIEVEDEEDAHLSLFGDSVHCRDANKDPGGFRVPASDLEKIVVQSLAGRLRDKSWLQSSLKDHFELVHFQPLMDASSHFANEVERQLPENTGLIQYLIERIVVEKKSVTVRIQPGRLAALLLGKEIDTTGQTSIAHGQSQQPIEIKVSGQFIRCGKEVRLVIGHDDAKGAKVDGRLVRELVQARQWFDGLANRRVASISGPRTNLWCQRALYQQEDLTGFPSAGHHGDDRHRHAAYAADA